MIPPCIKSVYERKIYMITQKDFPLQIKTKPHISFLCGEMCLTNVVIHNLDKSSNMQTVENRLHYLFILVLIFIYVLFQGYSIYIYFLIWIMNVTNPITNTIQATVNSFCRNLNNILNWNNYWANYHAAGQLFWQTVLTINQIGIDSPFPHSYNSLIQCKSIISK